MVPVTMWHDLHVVKLGGLRARPAIVGINAAGFNGKVNGAAQEAFLSRVPKHVLANVLVKKSLYRA
jgi:hypothetical protein